MSVQLFKSKDSKNKPFTFFGLLPYPFPGLIGLIPGISSFSFLSFILNPFINILVDAIFLFSVLSILISVTKNQSVISLKKVFIISILVAGVSWLYPYLVGSHLFYYLGENKTPPPFATILPTYIYNSVTQIVIPSIITLFILIVIFKILKIRNFILISIVASLVTTQWFYLYIIIHESKSSEQRYHIEQAGSKVTKGITHQIIGEELINDPNSKYRWLRINTKISVPETATYTIYTELRDVTGNDVAVQSYVNGKSLINPIDINLPAGENLVTFDFPYVYFNENFKAEYVNLPYNDTATGSYGPYRFTFSLTPSKTSDFNAQEAQSVGTNWTNVIYRPPVYETTKVYNYADFYQR